MCICFCMCGTQFRGGDGEFMVSAFRVNVFMRVYGVSSLAKPTTMTALHGRLPTPLCWWALPRISHTPPSDSDALSLSLSLLMLSLLHFWIWSSADSQTEEFNFLYTIKKCFAHICYRSEYTYCSATADNTISKTIKYERKPFYQRWNRNPIRSEHNK